MKEGVWDLFEILVSVYEGFNLWASLKTPYTNTDKSGIIRV